MNDTTPRDASQLGTDNPIPTTLPERIRQRLVGHGIQSLSDWRRLSRSQRRSLFGITGRMVAQLDSVATEERR